MTKPKFDHKPKSHSPLKWPVDPIAYAWQSINRRPLPEELKKP